MIRNPFVKVYEKGRTSNLRKVNEGRPILIVPSPLNRWCG